MYKPNWPDTRYLHNRKTFRDWQRFQDYAGGRPRLQLLKDAAGHVYAFRGRGN